MRQATLPETIQLIKASTCAAEILALCQTDLIAGAARIRRSVDCDEVDAIVAAYRLANPSSRAVGITYLVHNSGAKKQEASIIGGVGPSWCARWPKTVRAENFANDAYRSAKAQLAAVEADLMVGA